MNMWIREELLKEHVSVENEFGAGIRYRWDSKTQKWTLWIKGDKVMDFEGKKEDSFKDLEKIVYKIMWS